MNRLLILMLICVTLTSCGNAQGPNSKPGNDSGQLTYEQWKEAAKTEIRLNPMYGHWKKSSEQKAADERLINENVAQQGTRRKGSDALIRIGFDYLYKGNIKTAMYRFNQAWLLDSTNADVFWGFSAIYFTYKDTKKSMQMLEEGLQLDPGNAHLITDKATIYLVNSRSGADKGNLQKAIMILQESYAIDPLYDNTLFKLSMSYFLNQDCANAKRYYEECMKVGGKPIPADFARVLKERCK